jgi:mannose-1-phosphate guanylyltransferase/phosphomannomutase
MRQISEEHQSENTDLLDGIKIHNGQDWVLVLPDLVEPMFHVYAEAAEADQSLALVETYARRIENLQGKA